MSLKQDIIDHLKKKGNYDPDVDDYVIDMLLENIGYADQCKHEIRTYGLTQEMFGRNGVRYTKMNPSFGIYQMCLRNIHQCAAKLGINRKDRIALKLVEEKNIDEFDRDFK